MLQYLATLGVLDERVSRDDSSIRNNRIEMCHALCLGLFDSVKRRVFDRGVVFDNDEIASGAFGEVEEGLRGGVAGVAVGGDDGLLIVVLVIVMWWWLRKGFLRDLRGLAVRGTW